MNQINKIILYIKRVGIFAFVIKLIDLIFKPIGICFLSFYKLDDYDLNKNPYLKNNKIFFQIYKDHYWESKKSLSGSGSDIETLRSYYKNLSLFIEQFKIKSILDVPCGDFIFMNEFLKNKNINYLGGDIVDILIANNTKKYKNFSFTKFDIIKDQMNERFDILHLKDCIFHFSLKDIKKTLENIVNFNTRYTLITSHNSLILRNIDIQTGKFRFLDLKKEPFNFPAPLVKIKDLNFSLTEFPRYVGVWKTSDLKKHVESKK